MEEAVSAARIGVFCLRQSEEAMSWWPASTDHSIRSSQEIWRARSELPACTKALADEEEPAGEVTSQSVRSERHSRRSQIKSEKVEWLVTKRGSLVCSAHRA